MFDLFRSREKSVRILLGALLCVVALSMLTYLIPTYGQGNTSSSDSVIATVGSESVTLLDMQKIIQGTMRNRQLPPGTLVTFIPQMVQEAITDRALAYEAAQMGFQVSDADVASVIRQTIPNLFPDGKFVGRETYAAMLAQQDMSIEEFESDLKRQVLVNRLREVAVEGTVVTPQEIEAEYKKKNEKIKIQYAKLVTDKFKAEATPSMAEIQQFYQANAARYTMPEKKNLAILLADQTKMAATLTPSDTELQAIYNANKQQFQMPERVQVVHVLVNNQGKSPAEDAKLKAKADDILKQIRSGGNVTELVKKYSDDPGKVENNGEYWVQQDSGLVPEFKAAAFRLKPGESEVVKTTYGYHVMKVLKHEDAHLKTFEEAKSDLATQWKTQRVAAMMQQISDKVQADLQKDPQHPEAVAAKYNMQLVRADNVTPGASVPEIGVNNDFDQSIGGLKQGEVSQPVALPGNKLALAVVTAIVPSRLQTFDEAKDAIKESMISTRVNRLVQTKAGDLLAKAKSMGGDLAQAAKAMGLEVKTSEEFGRTGTVEGLGTATYLQDGFRTPDGGVFGPINVPDGEVVAKVLSHSAPDMAGLDAQRSEIRDELKSQKARDRNMLFEAGIRDQLIKSGKLKVNQQMLQRLISNYQTGS
ncbi:MAG TPA: peptidyl-prolyl cis-trans isomerase [Candidatus Sulfopaludibacter sp.]|jgi:peptidyl-prolyl cis-trans isomerase D|nr:peptidyl-prolyl cis-trans isomerase [Candidatus Sulfopaludibacter sp.]